MDPISSIQASLLLAQEDVERTRQALDVATHDCRAAVAKYDQLSQALALVQRALNPVQSTGTADSPTSPSGNLVRDRRAVDMTDSSKLRGLRRIAWDILKEAGSEGISNDDFVMQALSRMTPHQQQKTAKAAGGQRRAILDGHFALRKNASNFGITLEEGPRNHWTMRMVRPK